MFSLSTHFAFWSFHCASSVWPSSFETRLASPVCSDRWHEQFFRDPGHRDCCLFESSPAKPTVALPWTSSSPSSSCYPCHRVPSRNLPRTRYCSPPPRRDSEPCRVIWRLTERIARQWKVDENRRHRRNRPGDTPFLWLFSPNRQHPRFDHTWHILLQTFWNWENERKQILKFFYFIDD